MKVTKEWVKGVLDANGDGTITKDQDVLGQAEYFWILRAGPSQKYIYIFSALFQAWSSERAWSRQLSHVGTSTKMSLIFSLGLVGLLIYIAHSVQTQMVDHFAGLRANLFVCGVLVLAPIPHVFWFASIFGAVSGWFVYEECFVAGALVCGVASVVWIFV